MIRVEYYDNNNRLSQNIRDAQISKIPYQLVIGDQEIKSKKLSYRKYGQKQTKQTSLSEFIKLLQKQIAKRK